MKRFVILLTILFLPINVLAYSDFIVPGGNTLGIEVDTDGVMVIGFYKVKGKYNKSGLKTGDYIIKVNNDEVLSSDDMTRSIEKYVNDGKIDLTFLRNGKIMSTSMNLIEDDGKYKTGLYIKSTIKGIGTLSYIDPESKIFSSLGHEIQESTTSDIVEIKSGIIFNSKITSIDKSYIGSPGSKNAAFNYNQKYGNIIKNTKYGIFGEYTGNIDKSNLIEVASKDEVKVGSATMLTVIEGENVESFDIEILGIDQNASQKNILFEVKDDRLLTKTGGIVQGMSGSPIIQNNKIVGAVNFVIIDAPNKGYGIFITTMLEEGENN